MPRSKLGACCLLFFGILLCSTAVFGKQERLKGKETSSIRPHITGKGLSNVINAIFPLVQELAMKENIPDVKGNSNHFNFYVRNIKLRSISAPSIDIQVGQAQGFNPQLQHISGKLTLDWKYKLDRWPSWPEGSGSAEVTIRDAVATLFVQPVPGSAQANKPPIILNDVQISIPHLDVNIHGTVLDWFYNELIGLVKDPIKNAIAGNLRKVLRDVLNEQLNNAWGSIPFKQNIEGVPLDLGIVNEPAVVPAHTTTFDVPNPNVNSIDEEPSHISVKANIPAFVELYGNGRFEADAAECLAIKRSAALERYNCQKAEDFLLYKEKSISVVVDEYVIQSALCAFHARGSLKVTVEDDMLPQDIPVRLNTDSFKLLISNLYKEYPSKEMRLVISTAKAPNVVLSSVEAHNLLAVVFNIKTFVKTENTDTKQVEWVEAFTLGLDASFFFTAQVDNTHLSAKATVRNSDLKLLDTKIGDFYVWPLKTFMQTILLPRILLPLVNQVLGKGFDLPIPVPIKPVNGIVAYGDGCLAVGTDFMYVPTNKVMLNKNQVHVQQEKQIAAKQEETPAFSPSTHAMSPSPLLNHEAAEATKRARGHGHVREQKETPKKSMRGVAEEVVNQ
eukprot:GDKI01003094.1.p1 GENE.GDKI01003094.1~~GDKI01003094.1.p1  ORF type:complete len:617 (-),score=129.42 GDKI01003094.1:209-2059(-)